MEEARTFDFEPHNEMGVVFLFGRFYDVLGFEGIVHVGTRCPDCIVVRQGRTVRVEFEHRSSNYLNHRHALTQADVLVCWTADMDLAMETIELKSALQDRQRFQKVKPDLRTGRILADSERREAARKPANRMLLALLELERTREGLDPWRFASAWGMRPAGAARALARLLKRGLASRAADGSEVLFKITDYGREMADQVKEARPELHDLFNR
jgi:DNA-binding MarR family transcriptional regulator